jgi:hypothetical protein
MKLKYVNLQTPFESWTEFVYKFGFLFEVSNLEGETEEKQTEEISKYCQDLKKYFVLW